MTALDRFAREYQDVHQISPQRASQQMALLSQLDRDIAGGILELEPQHLNSLVGQWMGEQLHVNTIRKRLNMVRPFVSWAFENDLIDAERYMKIKRVKNPRGSTGRSTPKPYTRTEVIALWAVVAEKLPLLPAKGTGSQALKRWLSGKGPWKKVATHALRLQVTAMIRLALDMGLRRAEIFGLSVDDLHYDNEYLVVRSGKRDPNTGQFKVRKVPFTEDARQAVKDWLEFRALTHCGHDRPWLSCWGRDTYANAMCERRFNHLFHDLLGLDPSGEEGWSLHRLRHTCATNWLRAGAELETVSTMLGHASLQQTLAYAEILLGDIARKLGRVEGELRRMNDDGLEEAA